MTHYYPYTMEDALSIIDENVLLRHNLLRINDRECIYVIRVKITDAGCFATHYTENKELRNAAFFPLSYFELDKNGKYTEKYSGIFRSKDGWESGVSYITQSLSKVIEHYFSDKDGFCEMSGHQRIKIQHDINLAGQNGLLPVGRFFGETDK